MWSRILYLYFYENNSINLSRINNFFIEYNNNHDILNFLFLFLLSPFFNNTTIRLALQNESLSWCLFSSNHLSKFYANFIDSFFIVTYISSNFIVADR